MNVTWIDTGANLLVFMVPSLPFVFASVDKCNFTPEQMQVLKNAFHESVAVFAKLMDTRLRDMEAELEYNAVPVVHEKDATDVRAAISLKQ